MDRASERAACLFEIHPGLFEIHPGLFEIGTGSRANRAVHLLKNIQHLLKFKPLAIRYGVQRQRRDDW